MHFYTLIIGTDYLWRFEVRNPHFDGIFVFLNLYVPNCSLKKCSAMKVRIDPIVRTGTYFVTKKPCLCLLSAIDDLARTAVTNGILIIRQCIVWPTHISNEIF